MEKKKSVSKQNTILWGKVSHAMQVYYRMIGGECLGRSTNCMGRATVRHHHFHWGNSLPLRLEERNLVPLCTNCHASHHNGYQKTTINYRRAMEIIYGEDWEDQLIMIEREYIDKTPKEMSEYLKDRLSYYVNLAEVF